jgi:hypothetical protein
METNFIKGKNLQECPEKNALTNLINAAAKAFMVSENACQLLTDVKFWQAVEKKDVINLPFLMNTEVRNK